jgi:hypothetical protein
LGRTGLSRKELSPVEVMGRVKGRSLRLREAAELLAVSYRQGKRIRVSLHPETSQQPMFVKTRDCLNESPSLRRLQWMHAVRCLRNLFPASVYS